jgi:hypothetical protein
LSGHCPGHCPGHCLDIFQDILSVYSGDVQSRSKYSDSNLCSGTDDDQISKCDKEQSYFSNGLRLKLVKKSKSVKPSCDVLEVILDSGATSHKFPSTVVFQTYSDISHEERGVSLGDDKVKLSIEGVRRVEFLGESLHVPQLSDLYILFRSTRIQNSD